MIYLLIIIIVFSQICKSIYIKDLFGIAKRKLDMVRKIHLEDILYWQISQEGLDVYASVHFLDYMD